MVVSLALILLLSSCEQPPNYPKSDHYDGERFYNQDRATSVEPGWGDVLKWKIFNKATPWPAIVNDNVQPYVLKQPKAGEGAITHINHATQLIQLPQITVITDPVFSERVSPLSWLGPKRHRQPGVELSSLPKIDAVVVSHNHYDHLDKKSLLAIDEKDQAVFIVPLGNKKLLQSIGIKNVVELDWWQAFSLNGSKITLVPMQHWSARGLTDKCETLWGGYVIESDGLKVLFSGDTGYNRQFKEIEQRFGSMNASILPIGAYEPRWFMKSQHMSPKEAIQAHLDLKSHLSIGNHLGTFQLTDEGIDEPIHELHNNLKLRGIDPKQFITPKNGQTIILRHHKRSAVS